MARKLLIFDATFACHRAWHATGELDNGVVFGFLGSLLAMQELHPHTHCVFCFDRGESKRKEIFPDYKANREPKPKEFTFQLRALRREYLYRAGFRNVFSAMGYEADDIIASIVKGMRESDRAVIVSSDKDMYQLIEGERVVVYNPVKRRTVNQKVLKDLYGVHPTNWVNVKAIAGCATDGVPGINGIGDKTACKFILNKLKVTSKAQNAITGSQGQRTWRRNLPLVRLPFPGTPAFKIRRDNVTAESWTTLTRQLKMKSLEGAVK